MSKLGKRTLVTFGSNGFTDYVALPDGRSYNLGSVSVLKFVVDLAMNSHVARKALDLFLAKNQATLAVHLESLEQLLTPRRARWAAEVHSPLKDFVMPNDAPTLEVRNASVDNALKRELEIFMDNEDRLLSGKRVVIRSVKQLLRKGPYTQPKAVKLWAEWVDDGAKAYCKEFGGEPNEVFPKALRQKLAEDMETSELAAIKAGEYGEVTKDASVDNTLGVNEALARGVRAKIETILPIVREKKASAAQTDLYRIASDLSALVGSDELAHETATPKLVTLANKVKHVGDHFKV